MLLTQLPNLIKGVYADRFDSEGHGSYSRYEQSLNNSDLVIYKDGVELVRYHLSDDELNNHEKIGDEIIKTLG